MHIGIEMCYKSSFLYDVSDNTKIENFTFSCTYSQSFCVLNLHFILNSKVWKFLVLQVQTLMWPFYAGWNGFMQAVLCIETQFLLNFQDSANNKNVMELELIKARLYIESPIIKGLLSSSVIYPKL